MLAAASIVCLFQLAARCVSEPVTEPDYAASCSQQVAGNGMHDDTIMLLQTRKAIKKIGPFEIGVTCGLEKTSRLLTLASSSGVSGPDIKASLDKMVSALPASKGVADYSKLRLLEFYDPCMLKNSFWNTTDPDFQNPTGMNYRKANITNLSPDIVEPYFNYLGPQQQTLDLSYCYNEWTDASVTGGLKDLGFGRHSPASILDFMMEPKDFRTLLRVNLGIEDAQSAKALVEELQTKQVPDALKTLIDEADVVALSGGNPDLIAFVFRAFPAVADMLTSKLHRGEAVLLGRSAGSMVIGSMGMFSDEPTPEMFSNVLFDSSRSLGLLPKCIIKPHFKTEAHEAYASLLEEASGLHVVRMANEMAFACISGSCLLQGTPRTSDLEWHAAPGKYMQHLNEYFKSV
eukprot:TRINITY_DN92078_c0_g1_i1.p1 TRINITY_DN92078_c0_g1~~TRINITY_DN92078_c0_g1_i1.p1  ORF type:complete len:403 (+),score=83.00 TRINITY_DN92078_c0_g1_i1:63-1271(+)